MELDQAVLGRRSIRAFLPDPIPQDKIQNIVEPARWAPFLGKQSTVGNCRGRWGNGSSVANSICGGGHKRGWATLGHLYARRIA